MHCEIKPCNIFTTQSSRVSLYCLQTDNVNVIHFHPKTATFQLQLSSAYLQTISAGRRCHTIRLPRMTIPAIQKEFDASQQLGGPGVLSLCEPVKDDEHQLFRKGRRREDPASHATVPQMTKKCVCACVFSRQTIHYKLQALIYESYDTTS